MFFIDQTEQIIKVNALMAKNAGLQARIAQLEAELAQARLFPRPQDWPVIDPAMLAADRLKFEPFAYTERS